MRKNVVQNANSCVLAKRGGPDAVANVNELGPNGDAPLSTLLTSTWAKCSGKWANLLASSSSSSSLSSFWPPTSTTTTTRVCAYGMEGKVKKFNFEHKSCRTADEHAISCLSQPPGCSLARMWDYRRVEKGRESLVDHVNQATRTRTLWPPRVESGTHDRHEHMLAGW